ncbi:MAG: carbohydrate binding family 9 domain-containing protein [Bacteroidetes bacterium]|nr:carbohydrate binding family 9 domain-containing protein [Bacteroidota bacterium]
MRFFGTLLLTFLLCMSMAQTPNADLYQLPIKKAAGNIRLDGELNEPDWQAAATADHFKLMFPNDTSYSKFQVEAHATFDDRYLYIGAVCYQPRETYITQSLRRDFDPGTTDVLNMLFDPSKDGLNGFLFSISPYNVQREALISNGQQLSFEWDNKWYSSVKNYDDRWVIEVAIPFKTLRYSVSDGPNSWGLQFSRAKVQQFEVSTWAPVPFQYSTHNLAFAGRLLWDSPPPRPGANISLIPYVTSGGSVDYVRNDQSLEVQQKQFVWNRNIGGDAKVALTPGLNLDLTINPDFSQVEVDRQVPNLSRFELFFPETRQFFLENRDLFAFYGFPDTRPFFSRRIGLAWNPVLQRNEKVPIVAGARLSGKLNDQWRIGLLNMQTRRRDWNADTILPAANFTVATVQRKVFERSVLSAVVVNKQNFLGDLNNEQRADWQPWNRMAGLEYNLYSKDNRWEGEWYYHRSFSPDKAQRGSTLASFLSYNDRYFNAQLGYNRIDSTYSAEAGFVPRTGVQSFFPKLETRFYPKKGWAGRQVTNCYTGIEGSFTYGLNGKHTDRDASMYFGVGFKDQGYGQVALYNGYTYLFEAFDPTNLDAEGTDPLPVGGYGYSGFTAEYTSGTTTKLQGNISVTAGEYFNGDLFQVEGRLAYRLQPLGILSVLYSYNNIRLPKPYASADFWLVGPRVELAFSRSVFFSSFFQYNLQANNFNINARLQWRFAPVSDVYLVYTDNSYAQQIRNTPVQFFSPKNKAVILKVVYWLNL